MSAIRWLLIVLTVVLLAAYVGLTVTGFVRADYGEAGFSVTWPDPTIRAVREGYPAALAGIRAGDRLEFPEMSLHDRMTVLGYRTPLRGEVVSVIVLHDGVERSVLLRYRPYGNDTRAIVRTALSLVTAIFIAGLTIFVLMRSPTIDAFALWGFAVVWFQPASVAGYLTPDWVAFTSDAVIGDLITGTFCAGFIVLALRATGRWQNLERYELAAVCFGIVTFALAEYSDILILAFGQVPPPFVSALVVGNRVTLFTCTFIVAAIVIAALIRARGPSRIRLRWIAIGFGILAFGMALVFCISFFPSLDFAVWPNFLLLLTANAGFGTLAYAIVRHDLFDVGFVVNRAAIYAALTAVLVATFAGLNWSIGVLLKQTGLALPIDVMLAAAVGLSLNVIQRRVDRIVDRVFFRHRYEAELRLRRVARALGQLTDERAIGHALILEPVEALSLQSAALYKRAESGDYELLAARGWPEGSPLTVAAGDPLIVHFAGAGECLRLDDLPHDAAFPHGLPRPRIAFPLWGRNDLVAFALYSAHRNGATLDPDEVELIERIVVAAGVAFERVATITLERALANVNDQFAELKAEFDGVRARQDELLAALLGAASGPPRAITSEFR